MFEEQLHRDVYEASIRDKLTGAFSRRYLEEQLRTEMAYAERHDTEIALVLMDVDRFKEINDTYGHVAGDAVLEQLGGVVESTIRTEDLFARYGGDEFAVLLRDVSGDTMRTIGERIRSRVASHRFETDHAVIDMTVSVGVAAYEPLLMRDIDDLLEATDRSLYEAKEAGRNQLRVRENPLNQLDSATDTIQ
ncbi:MAG: GGDEF domain-containing protein [Bradymonadaceae bacterium]